MNHKLDKSLAILSVLVLAIFMDCCVASLGIPQEAIKEALIIISLSPEQATPINLKKSVYTNVKLKYKVSRSIEDFKKYLEPAGQIVCALHYGCNIGGLHDFPWGPALRFEIDKLQETGDFFPAFSHSKDLGGSVKGHVFLSLVASYLDKDGKKHSGVISNSLTIPAIFSTN